MNRRKFLRVSLMAGLTVPVLLTKNADAQSETKRVELEGQQKFETNKTTTNATPHDWGKMLEEVHETMRNSKNGIVGDFVKNNDIKYVGIKLLA